MSIRTKLLILCLVMAFIPLLVLSFVTLRDYGQLGRKLGTDLHDALLVRTQQSMREFLDEYALLLEQHRSNGRALVMLQATMIENSLLKPPAENFKPFTDRDFDQKNPAISSLLLNSDRRQAVGDGQFTTMAISYDHCAFRLPADADLTALQPKLNQLADRSNIYARLYNESGKWAFWQFAAFENGLHTTYPGHGGYPPEYDPRHRTWYTEAVKANGISWQAPIIDASTRRTLISVSCPIRDVNGRIVGVTGVDMPLQTALMQIKTVQTWARNAEVMLVLLTRTPEGERLWITAQRTYDVVGQNWQAPIKLSPFVLEDPQQQEELLATIKTDSPLMRKVNYGGKACYLAARNVSQGELAVIMLAPEEDVLALANNTEASVISAMEKQQRNMFFLALGVLVTVFIASYLLARDFSRPVLEMTAAVEQVAAGNLDTTVNARTRDEIGRMGRAFNGMLPKLREHMRMHNALSVAMEVQQSLLPQQPPMMENRDIAGKSIYCDETGGDYFDFLSLDRFSKDHLLATIGDVTGHGIAAALLMATGRALLRSRMEQPGSIAQVITDMNRHLINQRTPDRFMTLYCLLIDQRQRRFSWVSAGHDAAIAYDPDTDSFHELEGSDIPLGIDPDWKFTQHESDDWKTNRIIVLGTDGIWEARNPQEEFYGKERLCQIIKANAARTAEEISQAITDSVRQFRGTMAQLDDVTLVVLKLK